MLVSSSDYRLLASMSDFGYVDSLDYKKRQTEAYQSKVNSKFDQSTSIRAIQEEYPYGSGLFRETICRVVSVRTVGTGSKMSDSYKTLIFKDQEAPKGVGYLYKFEDNYWIACNSDIMSSPTDSIVVRRCNNMLKWKDDNGVVQSVPISFEEDAFYLTNEVKQDLTRNNGYRKAIIQRTPLTMSLTANKRFIFGNQCLKISGSGISDFLNQTTEDNDGASIIRLNFEYDIINKSVDDMVNKIANAYSDNIVVSINQQNTEYSVSASPYIFSGTVTNNGVVIDKEIIWVVNSSSSYALTQSNNVANITFNSVGEYVVGVYLKDNIDIKTDITIATTNIDIYSIQCSPQPEVIYKGDTGSYTLSLYKNGVIVPDALFLFEKIDTLTSSYYAYTVNNNIINIVNKKMSSSEVDIKCTCTNYTEADVYNIRLRLGGAW